MELQARHGAPQRVRDHDRYGPFYVTLGAGAERVELRWYRIEPDWARPPVDAAERVRAIELLAARLARATAPGELDAAVADLAPGGGIRAEGSSLVLEPAMPALDVARALGRPEAIVASTDVHISHFVLVAPAAARPGRCVAGGWRILPSLDRYPSGDDVPGLDRPAFASACSPSATPSASSASRGTDPGGSLHPLWGGAHLAGVNGGVTEPARFAPVRRLLCPRAAPVAR